MTEELAERLEKTLNHEANLGEDKTLTYLWNRWEALTKIKNKYKGDIYQIYKLEVVFYLLSTYDEEFDIWFNEEGKVKIKWLKTQNGMTGNTK